MGRPCFPVSLNEDLMQMQCIRSSLPFLLLSFIVFQHRFFLLLLLSCSSLERPILVSRTNTSSHLYVSLCIHLCRLLYFVFYYISISLYMWVYTAGRRLMRTIWLGISIWTKSAKCQIKKASRWVRQTFYFERYFFLSYLYPHIFVRLYINRHIPSILICTLCIISSVLSSDPTISMKIWKVNLCTQVNGSKSTFLYLCYTLFKLTPIIITRYIMKAFLYMNSQF